MNTTDSGTFAYLLRRLHEKSTYLMLPILLGLYGINLDGATMQILAAVGLSISGFALALLPENGAQRFVTTSQYLSDRLREPTTWAAIPVILGSIGIHVDVAMIHKISQGGIALGGVIAFLLAEPGTMPMLLVAQGTAPSGPPSIPGQPLPSIIIPQTPPTATQLTPSPASPSAAPPA